jgi:tRNA(fMet)-specific endonuclease VapC
MILLDSDIAIDLFRDYPPAVKWVGSLNQALAVAGFTGMELLHGCRDARDVKRAQEWLGGQHVLWPSGTDSARALQRYGERRLRFGLDPVDALIAETAIGAGLPLYTFNLRHFAAYPDLITIQPYTR